MKLLKRIAFIYILISLSACQWNRIADHDPQIDLLLVQSKVKIDTFWQDMALQPAAKRQFNRYESAYQDIHFDLKVLLELNQRRIDNQESITQTNNLLTLWRQDISRHKQQNSFKNFFLKRRHSEYQRMLISMLKAEQVKPLK